MSHTGWHWSVNLDKIVYLNDKKKGSKIKKVEEVEEEEKII